MKNYMMFVLFVFALFCSFMAGVEYGREEWYIRGYQDAVETIDKHLNEGREYEDTYIL